MSIFKRLSRFTRIFILVGLAFIIYGYLCRFIGIYFFWESKSVGWAILLIGMIGFLSDRIILRRIEKKNTVLEKIGVGFIIFILFVQTILVSIISFTDVYTIAKKHLTNEQILKTEIGNVTGFGLIPTGGVQKTIDSNGEYGSETIDFTVKGNKKFKDVTVYVVKYADRSDWEVQGIE